MSEKANGTKSDAAGSSIQALSKYKIVFLGDQGVGKTSIITRFIHDDFNKLYQVNKKGVSVNNERAVDSINQGLVFIDCRFHIHMFVRYNRPNTNDGSLYFMRYY